MQTLYVTTFSLQIDKANFKSPLVSYYIFYVDELKVTAWPHTIQLWTSSVNLVYILTPYRVEITSHIPMLNNL